MNQIKVNHKGKDVVLDATPEQFAILQASEKNIMELIDSWDDIISRAILDGDERYLLAYNGANPRMLGIKGEIELRVMCDVVNEGWVWQPGEQGWLPIFNLKDGGFAFSDSYLDNWDSFTFVGSRRCLKNEKLSNFCARKFPEVFKLIILNK